MGTKSGFCPQSLPLMHPDSCNAAGRCCSPRALRVLRGSRASRGSAARKEGWEGGWKRKEGEQSSKASFIKVKKKEEEERKRVSLEKSGTQTVWTREADLWSQDGFRAIVISLFVLFARFPRCGCLFQDVFFITSDWRGKSEMCHTGDRKWLADGSRRKLRGVRNGGNERFLCWRSHPALRGTPQMDDTPCMPSFSHTHTIIRRSSLKRPWSARLGCGLCTVLHPNWLVS